ncbi:LysR family transcriptional regulator [Opitutus sp. ER46]|uniref:LysR family transcriptional regulator n=1 Tax=Opitutus sp. ER46 TaxID=2161864 RepID=UPI000D315D38|nr:LysR family transcriptional regulator [Opitutus sp. ER46]PTX91563.1 LysR family transcriptional regulator [Opitutus sp. ER46]
MDFRDLEMLVEVARQGGFSAAAKVLNTTQPTVSKAVQQLEHDCGAVLLDRLAQGVRLTSAGEMVVRRASTIMTEREHLRAELADLRGLQRGRLKLGLPTLGSSTLFAPLFAAFRRKYPGIEIELHEHGSKRLEEAVRAGEIELGVSLRPVPDDFEWSAVCDEPMLALLPSGHPLVGRAAIKLTDIARDPFIFFERGFALNGIITAACRRRRFTLNEAARSGHADFIIALVAAGLGVALLPRIVVAARRPLSVETVLVDETDLRWQPGFIWRKGATLSPAANRWLALVAGGKAEAGRARKTKG